ncbi:hypothetical protein EW146_g7305, partial [Bondarzewia mesenterica]
MATISTQLRNFKELDKDQQTQLFFSIPHDHIKSPGDQGFDEGHESMEINAVLSLGVHGEEDSYAGKLHLFPPYLAFVSLDRKSVRFTIPLC